MEKQIFLSGAKRPEGVNIYREVSTSAHESNCGIHTLIPGGLNGYSEGNNRTPWYSPPANGESGGPR